jgi:hypothetical protein
MSEGLSVCWVVDSGSVLEGEEAARRGGRLEEVSWGE